ncbi:GTP cyclohydrolase 1 type 2, NIF3 family [Haloferula helveola]|uniref:GTP cyclohydrolase 1 type 2, NIF3 family n=1 Tax=Haloferula helveola TaxID=490095 RepID=A0ABM7RBE1_9BACT|nr:GTP cyclohydrolase 1 type 2, NIF3 family [Haloferula helveola]
MANLREIEAFLNEQLRIAEIPDYSGAVNGLQLDGAGDVRKVIAAVDASLPVVEKAVAAGGDLLIVHHGMFWQGTQPLVGPFFRKIKCAMDAGMAIYSAHLPLDVHPEWGNNACLVRDLGIEPTGTFLGSKGVDIGIVGTVDTTREALARKLEAVVGGAVHVCPGGSEAVRRIGICSGGAGSEVGEAAKCGVDTFITGEGPHWSYPLAEELGINLFYGGHYATETFGVRALSEVLRSRFGVAAEFIDHPTGL